MTKKTAESPDKLRQLLKSRDTQGVHEAEIERTLKLAPEEALERAQALESEGAAVILTFAPLFLLSKESLQFLEGKILRYVEQYNAKHPDELGVSLAKIEKRFDVPGKVLNLALKGLTREGKVREAGGTFSAAAFEPLLTQAEEGLLAELEAVAGRGELDAGAIKDIREREHISPGRIDKLVAILVERKRVVQGKDGFYVDSAWLDQLAARLKERPSRDLSVADFKEMTGLSRKFAIPLLELLDEMGVTRRKGTNREIL